MQELKNQAAQADGARQELVKRVNTVRLEHKSDVVAEAEEHAEALFREAVDLQQWVFKNQSCISAVRRMSLKTPPCVTERCPVPSRRSVSAAATGKR